jgi:hypothetical protein
MLFKKRCRLVTRDAETTLNNKRNNKYINQWSYLPKNYDVRMRNEPDRTHMRKEEHRANEGNKTKMKKWQAINMVLECTDQILTAAESGI